MAVPKLRFKDEHGEEFLGWEEKKLGDVCVTFSGGTPSVTNSTYYNGCIPFIKSGEINKSYTEAFLTEKGLKNSSAKLVKKGDLLYALYGATSGESGISKINGAINQAILCIKSDILDLKYLKNLLCFNKNRITGMYLQGGQGNLSAEIIKSLKFYFPSSPEQTKIANFLSAIDEKISHINKKLDLLKQYKKGMMQKIFNQDIRFKDENGEEFPEWEEKEFNNVFSTIPSKKYQIFSTEINEVGQFPVLDQSQALIAGYSDQQDKVCHISPIIVFGDHTTVVKYFEKPFIVGADGTKLLFCHNGITKFFLYVIEFDPVIPEGYKRHFSLLREKNFPFPCIEEQTKIANFLSAIDEKIALVEKQLASTREYKKGLMQQLFI
ncbi:restriction endonuclease subunit S [Oxalobacter paraformigenes]|nr:restriction endonuclease subunit S [Oxalobacter paraformigenes]